MQTYRQIANVLGIEQSTVADSQAPGAEPAGCPVPAKARQPLRVRRARGSPASGHQEAGTLRAPGAWSDWRSPVEHASRGVGVCPCGHRRPLARALSSVHPDETSWSACQALLHRALLRQPRDPPYPGAHRQRRLLSLPSFPASGQAVEAETPPDQAIQPTH